MQSKLITPTKAAAKYDITVRQLLDLERRGKIPAAVRLNARVVRFNDDEHPAPVKR